LNKINVILGIKNTGLENKLNIFVFSALIYSLTAEF